jgi:hypothetical protein
MGWKSPNCWRRQTRSSVVPRWARLYSIRDGERFVRCFCADRHHHPFVLSVALAAAMRQPLHMKVGAGGCEWSGWGRGCGASVGVGLRMGAAAADY